MSGIIYSSMPCRIAMELLCALIGALIGTALERMTSFLKAVFFTMRHWRIRGTYTHDNGRVTISTKLGNRFVTKGAETNEANSWTGSFHLDDLYMRTGRGAYRFSIVKTTGATITFDCWRMATSLFNGKT